MLPARQLTLNDALENLLLLHLFLLYSHRPDFCEISYLELFARISVHILVSVKTGQK